MKCECVRCRGTGTVICPDCDGDGDAEERLEHASVPKSHTHYAELVALQDDIARVRRDAAKLVLMNPARAESYAAQEQATVEAIERQADRLTGRKRV